MKRRALIVDDEPHVRLLMKRVLMRAGWDVVAVADIGSALEHIRSVDVMIVDYYLAKERGPDLVRQAQREIGPLTPPALLVTGTPQEVPAEDQRLFLGALTKPFKVDALVEAADQAAPRKRRSGTRRKASLFGFDAPAEKDEAV